MKTVEDMKRPQVNLMGIIPPRETEAIDALNVVMVGEPALKGDGDAEDEFDAAFFYDMYGRRSASETPAASGSKPAILAQTGTQQKMNFSQRPTPANKGGWSAMKQVRQEPAGSMANKGEWSAMK